MTDGLRVLLVEDDGAMRRMLVRTLESISKDVSVDEAETLAAGLAKLRSEQRYDCALIDFRLPDGSGLELLESMQGQGLRTPVVMLTGHDDDATAMEAIQRGAQDYLVKTYADPRLLLRSIRYAIERRRAGEMRVQMLHMEKLAAIGTLAAGVAHEINNPLAYIIDNLGFVSQEIPGVLKNLKADPARAEAALQQMLEVLAEASQGAERVRTIVADLKSFARPDSEALAPVQLQPVVESAINMAWNQIKHRAQLVRDYQPVPAVRATPSRLTQVFLNLLVNAAQAIPDGKPDDHRIEVAMRPDGKAVLVEFRDTGPGIAPDLATRIFEPFFTTKPVGAGTGLGLSVCLGIVKAIGGNLTYSPAQPHGAIFTVRLPAAG